MRRYSDVFSVAEFLDLVSGEVLSAKALGWGVVIEVTKYYEINTYVPLDGNMSNSTRDISKIISFCDTRSQ